MTTSLRYPLVVGLLLVAGIARAAPVTFDLTATSAPGTMPDGTVITMIGYVRAPETALVAPGGPTLVVNQGDVVTVNLTNALTEPTSLHFQGQAMTPDTTGVGAGATRSYTFTASSPGTFLYEAGVAANSPQQVARGLRGALVVRPAATSPAQAYAGAASAYDDEAVLVLGEIDPALSGTAANPLAFDMRDFQPRYFLINGKAWPATDPIPTGPGRRVLLRIVNGGVQQHSMTLLGAQQLLVGKDGSELALPVRRVAETVAPGETLDAIVTVPATTPPGGRLAVFDGSLKLYNGSASGFGGMLTFLVAGAGPSCTTDTAGPAAAAVAAGAITGGSVVLSATITDAATCNSAVTQAEYTLDGGTAVPMTGSFGTPVVAVTATVSVAGLSAGNHTLSVRGRDAAGNWGAPGQAVVYVPPADGAGPTASGLTVTPATVNPSAGATVSLSATISDAASGNSGIAAAQYRIDSAQTGSPMQGSFGSTSVVAVTATVPVAGLSSGAHTISVRGQDAAGNWGAWASAPFVADGTGPVVTGAKANPPASNGVTGYNSSIAAVRVTATATDALSNVVAAEGFIDVLGAAGSGIVFVVADGQWDELAEDVYGDIPLTTVNLLSTGSHTIYVRAKDAAGNWSSAATTTLVVDKTAPTLSGISLSPTTAAAGEAVTLTANGATDTGSGVAGGQYWIDGTSTPPANATGFNGLTATLSVATGGVHTVYARVRDVAGNWSPVRSATITVVQAVNDSLTLTASTNASQSGSVSSGQSVLANDLPTGVGGRTAAIATAPQKTGTGAGTLTLSCPASLGTATTSVGGNAICTNGRYQWTLTGVGNTGSARQSSKRGTYTFTYAETLNGKSSTATVTITVN